MPTPRPTIAPWSGCASTTGRAHGLLPAAFATVRNPAGQVLMVRRIDDGNWELPGGRVEVGETVAEAVIREVAESPVWTSR